jgi:hypothetical protein
MATIGATVLTLSDWAKRLDPDGKIAAIGELLSQQNPILQDMLFMEGNLPTGHRTTVRTGLPTVAWRLLNGGVTPSKSRTAQLDEQCGMLEAFSEVDVDLAKLNGDVSAFRMSEAISFIESMNIEAGQTVFYGNSSTAPEEFTGLHPRFSDSSGPANADNIISGGGSQSDNTSVWLIVWGPNTVHGIFPKGSTAGLMHEDLGVETVQLSTALGGGRMRAYRDHWQWKLGIALRDWRYVVRICNIDIGSLVAESAAANLTKLMIRAWHRIPNLGMGRPAFYMNRTVAQMLDIQRFGTMGAGISASTPGTQTLQAATVVGGGGIQYGSVDGQWTPTFRGIPIRVCDAIVENEATIS